MSYKKLNINTNKKLILLLNNFVLKMIFGELVINEVLKYPEFYQMNKEEYKESSKKNLFYPKIAAALSITCAREITSK